MSELPVSEPEPRADCDLDSDVQAEEHEAAATPLLTTAADHGAAEHAQRPDHEDPLAEAFFRHPDRPVIDVWEDDAPVIHTMSRGSRRAMYASISIFVMSTVAISAYSVYQNWIMPAPAALGVAAGDTPAVLPTPVQPLQPSAAEPEPRETQVHAATSPQPALPSNDTLAAVLARPAAAAAPAGVAQVEGVVGAHFAANAEAEWPASPPPVTASRPGPSATDAVAADEAAVNRAAGSGLGGPTYDELVAVGRSLSKRNRRVEASEAFRRALLKSHRGSAALSGLSYVYLNAEENQTARTYAQRAVQVDASNAEGWIVLGAALQLLGDRSGAQDAYRSCVERGQGPYVHECRQVVR